MKKRAELAPRAFLFYQLAKNLKFVLYISMNNLSVCNSPSFTAKPIPKKVIDDAVLQLTNDDVNSVDIFCHASADEDTVNSARVFADWLTSRGKQVNICVSESDIRDLYFNPKKYPLKKDANCASKALVVDFSANERLPLEYMDLFEKYKPEDVVGFDHHDSGKNKVKGEVYVDTTSKSCSGVLTRFFDGLGERLPKKDVKSLYCGMLSDYRKSGLLTLSARNGEYSIERTEKLLEDKNSVEVLDKVESRLSDKDKTRIYRHLDVLSNLTESQKKLRARLYEETKVSDNGKLAYVVIDPEDKLWAKSGMDNVATSEILKDYRIRTLNSQEDSEFIIRPEDKEKLKNVESVIAFYRKSDDSPEYKMSIHSKSDSALELIDRAKSLNPNIIGGGHADRAGGKINSLDRSDIESFVSAMVSASEIL